ncbi:D-tyrosyl-tRNA(Tyr) deacylase family protein [Parvimonas sp. oral taxon 110 str. F0139]|nr:D-tyrosyl-tRNA(Tyr) deacylase family protein [Parvimonas sp. oral taxon 110 str. F0139]
MRAVIQRVNFARVVVDEKEVSRINKGLLLFIGFGKEDTIDDLNYIYKKL